MTTTSFQLGYKPSLDGLRGICVLLVMGMHAGIPLVGRGYLGVDGFFVLSGFLITALLLQEWRREGSINLRYFYIRRALRLFPALFLLLAVCGLVAITTFTGRDLTSNSQGIMFTLAYINNWGMAILGTDYQGFGLVQHGWSLSVEEQFYFVWPLLLIFLLSRRLKSTQVLAVLSLAAAASMLLRAWLFATGTFIERLDRGTDTRADSLLVGCILAVALSTGLVVSTDKLRRVMRFVAAIAVMALAYFCTDYAWLPAPFRYYGGYTLVALTFGAVILHLMISSPTGVMSRVLSWQPLVKVGVVSYGLYLWHWPVIALVGTDERGWADWQAQLMRLGLTVLVTTISYRYIERPILRLKGRMSGREISATASHKPQSAPPVA